jgi:hypothetical protein
MVVWRKFAMSFLNQQISPILRRFYLFLVDATDGITPETGEAGGQPQISVNGAGFVNTANVLVAISNGSYYVELTAAELGIQGSLIIRYKSANTAEFQSLASIRGGPV